MVADGQVREIAPLEAFMSIRDQLQRGPLGFGAAPLGNMFRAIPDEEAAATVAYLKVMLKAKDNPRGRSAIPVAQLSRPE